MGKGNLDLTVINTTPGAGGPLSPPAGWTGTAKDYWSWLRERYRLDPGARQIIEVIARNYDNPRGQPIVITGEFGEVAVHIIRKIKKA